MNKPAAFPLRLPRSIKDGAQRLAAQDGISLNQFIATAVAEKLSVLESTAYLEDRARRADMEAFWSILNRADTDQPQPGDELPKGYRATTTAPPAR